jgi:hypothetical protein
MIVSSLEFAGDSGSLSNINSTQGEFRAQIAALTDMVKQIVGNAAVSAGNTAQADPLSAPFQLYVNPYTGSDQFEGGSYNDYETTAADRLKRLEKQRLVCGYSPQRPFKTINRAVLEAAIITSKDWYAPTDIAATTDVVSIILSPGEHDLYNDPGQSSTTITSYGASRDVSAADLIKFNPATVGGVLLPRGCSLCGADLRKTVIRPNWVPAAADEASDYSNRRGMLKITGTGYFFGFTIKDNASTTTSHHLLDGFHFASEAELDDFYAKTFSAVGSGADLSSALTVARSTEYQIVGPIEQGQNPSSAWDTTASASPYIFNCSIRSEYGLGGAFMDGSKVEGLRSMVCANFTGVSLQKDMSCWEIYQSGSWVQPTYQQYIDADPDDVRMKPERVSRHISAINDSIIQEVSIFAIGQGIHHFTDLGGEVSITNSNSSFGGCAAYSKGYKNAAFPSDKNWAVSKIRVPLDLQEKTGNIRKIFLGTISAVTSSTITLASDLAIDSSSTSTPQILLNDGYTLKSGTHIWAENPQGDPWYAPLAANAWDSSAATEIDITAAFANTAGEPTIGIDGTTNLLLGKRVYIRRLVDTRTPNERRVSIVASNTASVRLPQRNFIIQTDPARSGGAISQEFTKTGPEIFAVSNAGAGDELGVTTSAELTLRRSAPSQAYVSGEFYPAGAVVKHNNKHFIANKDIYTSTSSPDTTVWLETFVHTEESYNSEDPITQEARQIVIDTDTDTDGASTTLGITWSTVWADYSYRSSTDYKGMHAFLVALGFNDAQAHAALVPQSADDRLLDPASATDFPDAPSGGAATGLGNWAIEFRRPSTLRLYGHAWEWAGFLNYSKAVPAVQKDLGAQNAFTYYFTHDSGGRVVPQGSNENGFNITPRGLEDVETGSTLTVEDIGSSSIDDVQQTNFEQLDVDVLNVNTINVGTALNFDFGDPIGASTTDKGVVELASLTELQAAAPAATDGQINADPKVVTTRGLAYWQNSQRLVQSLPSGVPYALLHVCSASGTPLTGSNSIPYGQETNSALEWSASGNAFHDTIFTSLTEAVEKASQLFLPTGSTIVISVHDDLGVIERGPIQLVNGFTRFDVVGARGATAPTVRMKWGTTANACARIPQYSSVESFSAGAVFADLTLELDNNNRNDVVATFNGGYGVGGRDTVVNWSNVGPYCCAATCSYGGDIIFKFYNTDSDTFYLTNNVVSTSSANVRFNFTGSDTAESGLTGHGCNLIVDLRSTSTQGGLRFVNGTAISPKLSLLDLGKRGGVKCGGRVVPQLKYDFSNDNWDLSELIGINYSQNQNYQGKAFRAEKIASGATASSTYSINATSLATVVPVVLKNGCCCDVTQDNATAPLESGFLSILGELEKDPGITGLLLTADNPTNSFVYNSTNSARNTP